MLHQASGPFLPAQMTHPSPLTVLETRSVRWIMLMQVTRTPSLQSSTPFIHHQIIHPAIREYHVVGFIAANRRQVLFNASVRLKALPLLNLEDEDNPIDAPQASLLVIVNFNLLSSSD